MPTPSAICHIEIPSTDLDASKRFFETVFGWKVTTNEHMPRYAFFEEPSVSGAFDLDRKPCTDPDSGVNLYLQVDDIETHLATIKTAGGKTAKPRTEIAENYGHYAHFTDPSGNLLGIWSKQG